MNPINIGKDFSPVPSGRFYSDKTGASGEQFREEVLWPEIKKLSENEKLVIILDDTVEGYGSSFLVEGFAGIVKFGYMKSSDLISKLEIRYTEPDFSFYKEKIFQYIEAAIFNSEVYKSTKAK